jgi:putative two-component system response regulator
MAALVRSNLEEFASSTERADIRSTTEIISHALKKKGAITLEKVYEISRLAEFHGEDAHGHIERISHYSTSVARAMGLDENFRQNILFASPLHDIGNLSLPDDVLRKPGKLTDNEWEMMREHSPFGAKILQEYEAEFLQMAEMIAATHHEKWDGTGYPAGLAGNQIPLAGRIVAVTDVFDVLTWERPYHEAISPEEAFRIIQQDKGKSYDPDVVDSFFNIQEEIVGEFNWWKFLGTD